MPESQLTLAEIEARIAIVQNNLVELTEQAAASSGAAVEELNAERIAEQQEKLQLLIKQREELARQQSDE